MVVLLVESVPEASGQAEPESEPSALAVPVASPVADVGASTELAVPRRRARRAVGARWVASAAWHRDEGKGKTKTTFTTPPGYLVTVENGNALVGDLPMVSPAVLGE